LSFCKTTSAFDWCWQHAIIYFWHAIAALVNSLNLDQVFWFMMACALNFADLFKPNRIFHDVKLNFISG
jgi:hypothetical protein